MGPYPALVFRGFTLRRPAAVFVVSAVPLLAWVIARLDDPQPGGDGPAQRRQARLVGRGLGRCVPEASCWNKSDPNHAYLSGARPIPAKELTRARIAADHVIDSTAPDPTGGATHYYATTMPKPPTWAKGAKQTLKVGHHIFFKDVP